MDSVKYFLWWHSQERAGFSESIHTSVMSQTIVNMEFWLREGQKQMNHEPLKSESFHLVAKKHIFSSFLSWSQK